MPFYACPPACLVILLLVLSVAVPVTATTIDPDLDLDAIVINSVETSGAQGFPNVIDPADPLFNAPMYTKSYKDEIALAVADPAVFAHFKSKDVLPTTHIILFDWYLHGGIMHKANQCLSYYAPWLLDHLPALAAQDLAVGSPAVNTFPIPSPLITGLGLSKDTAVNASPNVVKYLYELLLIERAFAPTIAPAMNAFRGMRIVEIGGGYGGFAHTIATFHNVQSYTIVDIDVVNSLQKLYLAAIKSPAAEKMEYIGTTSVPGRDATADPKYDLFLSFFSISEQRTIAVDAYARHFMARSTRGYLQLNYDEDISVDGSVTASTGRYNVLQLFRLVLTMHPTARLLGPAPCGVYEHVRIVWGGAVGGEFMPRALDSEGREASWR